MAAMNHPTRKVQVSAVANDLRLWTLSDLGESKRLQRDHSIETS